MNRSIPTGAYPDPVARETATQLESATVVRFSAGDAMPPAVQRAWWDAMRKLVNDPGALDGVLQSLTAKAAAAK